MLKYTIINVAVGVIVLLICLVIMHPKKVKRCCETCKHLKVKCSNGSNYKGHRYHCKYFMFDDPPDACGYYQPREDGETYEEM